MSFKLILSVKSGWIIFLFPYFMWGFSSWQWSSCECPVLLVMDRQRENRGTACGGQRLWHSNNKRRSLKIIINHCDLWIADLDLEHCISCPDRNSINSCEQSVCVWVCKMRHLKCEKCDHWTWFGFKAKLNFDRQWFYLFLHMKNKGSVDYLWMEIGWKII